MGGSAQVSTDFLGVFAGEGFERGLLPLSTFADTCFARY